ncbi:MAG TPA: terminase family protein [Rhizobiaceae bacterium]|nr:terminase family protein [Rhizobiaceae bacterium]
MQPNWLRENLTPHQQLQVLDEWIATARLAQLPMGRPAPIWLVLGGRGAGKTRLGAEWVNAHVRGFAPFATQRYGQIALVGETLGDVREVMIDGPSGIVTIARRDRPRFEASRRRLLWDNGAVAQIFSSEDPDSLRGPQFDAAWCDEIAKWKNVEACFDMLQFGLRLGEAPRQILTTTPRPIPLLRRLLDEAGVRVSRMATRENAGNLAPGFMDAVERRYGATRLGRQELEGLLIEDRDDALWSRAALEAAIVSASGELRRIVVAVDPAASSHAGSDACGIVVAGLLADGRVLVLEDATLRAAKPDAWAAKVAALYEVHGADCVVAEVNQGGDMVAAVLRAVDPAVPVKAVRATRGKWLRAEPVAALYAQGRVVHARRFPALEDEMCDFGPDGLSDGRSPDRVDALVWAVTELALGRGGKPRVRNLK